MNVRKRRACIACGVALLLTLSVADVAAYAPRFESGPGADAAQRRRTRRKTKRRKAVRTEVGRVSEGLWGGMHLRLSVRGDGAGLEFDCAHGEISAPFTLDGEGRFDLPGTYTREGPGPIRIGREPTARPAHYAGRVEGERMILSVRLEGSDKQLGEYTLTHGDEGRIVKCR